MFLEREARCELNFFCFVVEFKILRDKIFGIIRGQLFLAVLWKLQNRNVRLLVRQELVANSIGDFFISLAQINAGLFILRLKQLQKVVGKIKLLFNLQEFPLLFF